MRAAVLAAPALTRPEAGRPGLAVAARRLLLDPAGPTDPALYQRLLTEAPILRVGSAWLVSGYAEVCWLAASPHLSVDPRAGDPPLPLTQSEQLEALFGRMLNFRDGEPHTRLRRLVSSAFSARRAQQTAVVVDAVVAELLHDLCERDGFDAVADLGVPLPVMTSCALLDLPREMWPVVARWAGEMSAQLFRFGQDPTRVAEVEAHFAALTRYSDGLAEERRGRPGDLIGELLREAETGDGLTRDEFVAFVVLLFMNGLETVTAAVASCVAALLWRPGLAEAVRADADLATAVFDELMRLECPARMGARRATAVIEMAGNEMAGSNVARIEPNDPVFLLWAVANRDPGVFAAPDEFRPGRSGRHLAFGQGAHHCLGGALARLQGAAVLRQLAQRPHLASPLTASTAPRRKGAAVAGYAELPVTTKLGAQR
jgi:cytochrome P450